MANSSNGHAGGSSIDKRDFDAHRPLLRGDSEIENDEDGRKQKHHRRSGSESWRVTTSVDGGGGDGLLSNVVEEIVERDRRKMKREVIRVCSFIWGVVSW